MVNDIYCGCFSRDGLVELKTIHSERMEGVSDALCSSTLLMAIVCKLMTFIKPLCLFECSSLD